MVSSMAAGDSSSRTRSSSSTTGRHFHRRISIKPSNAAARSMRTVRSNRYCNHHTDHVDDRVDDDHHHHFDHSQYLQDLAGDDEEEALHYSSAKASPSNLSENLTDSVVDFRLRELAISMPSASKSTSADFATQLLNDDDDDDDDDSSTVTHHDLHSFGSDISGELQRLASVTGDSPSLLNNGRHASARPTSTPDVVEEIVPELSSWVESIVSSSEILESASAESVEPAVRACAEVLESGLASMDSKRTAAGKLRLLAKHRSDFRAVIGESGAIPALVALLKSTDPGAQENAVTALLNLSLEEENKARLRAAGAIKPLVYALRTGTAASKQNAACALLSLSMVDDDSRAIIGACGAIPPLVSLLVSGSTRGKKDALTALYKLCGASQNKERAVRAGAVGPLLQLAIPEGHHHHHHSISDKAMVVLSSLAGIPEGRDAIEEGGGIPALVEAIEDSSARGKEFAVITLLHLCADSPRNRALLVREGAIPPLVALSQSGSVRAKNKAETLLGYLREQRQRENTVSAVAGAGFLR